MDIHRETHVRDIATAQPSSIRVFQQHHIDFCCGGRLPLSEACRGNGLDTETILAELRAADGGDEEIPDWSAASLAELIAHIQTRYHEHLRAELPRLRTMLAKVVSRHGDSLGSVLLPLQETFTALERELLEHMFKEDMVLFPAIVSVEEAGHAHVVAQAARLQRVVHAMERDHAEAGDAIARMRGLTNGFVPPEWACPTFLGLYHGLAQFERDMHVHVHLENNVLFPRALAIA